MTAGLPGTGIGGMFYLLSAVVMPLREALRRARGRGRPIAGGWRVVAGQTAIAGGIIAGMWATGWLLGVSLRAVHPIVMHGAASHASNLLRTAALALSIGTLVAVLGGVELLRLWLQPRPRRVAAAWVGRGLIVLLVLEVVGAVHPRAAVAQSAGGTAGHLGRADSAFAAGNPVVAAREYAAVLATDPENSHATYRLAQLRRRDPAEALRLFRRYVALEPSDPWGYMAVGDALTRAGRYAEALAWYDDALARAPGERDAVVGRARVLARARRTDAAVAAYRQWLAAHPKDAEAWGELAREALRAGRPEDAAQALARAQALAPDAATAQRLAVAQAAAAPAVTPLASGSHDSDGNTRFRLGGSAELAADGPVRLGVAAGRAQVGDGFTTRGLEDVALRAVWQPRAVLHVDAAAGANRLDAVGGAGSTVIPVGQLRARWRAPGAGPALDLRAQRSLLDASPLLVANRVVRTELRALVELPVAGVLKLRGIGRAAALSDSAEVNHRTTVEGVVAFPVTPSVELSGQIHEIRYAHASGAGYFAPRLAQVVEAGSYVEFETARSVLVAVDVGVGALRVAEQGARIGPWRRSLRLYSLIVVPLAPGRDLRLELEGEDSGVANEAATTAQWRYGSAALSLRWALL